MTQGCLCNRIFLNEARNNYDPLWMGLIYQIIFTIQNTTFIEITFYKFTILLYFIKLLYSIILDTIKVETVNILNFCQEAFGKGSF